MSDSDPGPSDSWDTSGAGDPGAVGGAAPDSVTETTTQGWLSRILGGFVAALIGLVLVPAAVVLISWNEGRAVDAIRALNRGAASVVEVNADTLDASANGKLVHLTGMARPGAAAADPVFGVAGDGLIRLRRTVEMYQWKQDSHSTTSNNLGGSKTTETTYTYERVWSEQPIDSASFKASNGHRNPPMPVRSATFDGSEVKIGAYKLDPSVMDKLTGFAPLPARAAAPAGYTANGDGYYMGHDPGAPSVGDVRVSFGSVPAQTVSAAAALSSGVLTAYSDPNGYRIALAEPGVVPAAVLFHDEKASESTLTWILRGVGFALVLIGFVCLTRPLTMLAAVVPFLSTIVGAGAFLAALLLAIPVTLITIALAWIAHRPLIGIGLLAVGLAVLFSSRWLPSRRPPGMGRPGAVAAR